MKNYSDILDEVYKPKSADERRFMDKHVALKRKVGVDSEEGEDELFQAKGIKTIERAKERHGYDPGEDEKVYEGTKDNMFNREERVIRDKNGKVIGHSWKDKKGEIHAEHKKSGMSWAGYDSHGEAAKHLRDHDDEHERYEKKLQKENTSTADYPHDTPKGFPKILRDVAKKYEEKKKKRENVKEGVITEDWKKHNVKHMRNACGHCDTIQKTLMKMISSGQHHYDAKFLARQLEDIAEQVKNNSETASSTPSTGRY